MRRKSLGKGIHALIRSKIDEKDKEKEEKRESSLANGIEIPELESEESEQIRPRPVKPAIERTERTDESDTPEHFIPPESRSKSISPQAAPSRPEPEVKPVETPGVADPATDLIPENLLEQLKEIKEVDFDEKRLATYQKALERAWFDEKITADEQFILDGLREVLEISEEEHRNIETGILHQLEKRYSEGIDKQIPLGKIENEHERKKREIYDYFQKGSELYEADKYFEAIMEWEKILELDPTNPIIMKAINNARRRLDSPSLEALGQETVYSYSNPLKAIQEEEEQERLEEERRQAEKKRKEAEDQKRKEEDRKREEELKIIEEEKRKREEELKRIEEEKKKLEQLAMEAKKKPEEKVKAIPGPKVGKQVTRKAVKVDNSQWIKKQKEIQSALIEIKKEEEEERRKIEKLFKLGYKNYKSKKYHRALKIWRKILELDPEHLKARKGIKLAKKKYVMLKKKREKVKEEKKVEEVSEMEIPELVEGEVVEGEVVEGEVVVAGIVKEPALTEMEISELAQESELGVEPDDAQVITADVAGDVAEVPVSEPEPEELKVEGELTKAEVVSEKLEEELAVEPEPETVKVAPEEPVPVFKEEPEPEEAPPPERTPEEIEREFYERAANFARIGKFKDALELLDEVTGLNPGNVEAWNDMGILNWSLGNIDEALECYEKAVQLDPGYTDAWVNKGVVLNRLNRRDAALEAYNRAISIDGNLEEAWTNRGVVLYNLMKMEEAAESFKKGLEINPDSEEAWLNLGNTFEKMERFSDAIKAFERVLELDSKNADAHAGIQACQKNLKYEILKQWNI